MMQGKGTHVFHLFAEGSYNNLLWLLVLIDKDTYGVGVVLFCIKIVR